MWSEICWWPANEQLTVLQVQADRKVRSCSLDRQMAMLVRQKCHLARIRQTNWLCHSFSPVRVSVPTTITSAVATIIIILTTINSQWAGIQTMCLWSHSLWCRLQTSTCHCGHDSNTSHTWGRCPHPLHHFSPSIILYLYQFLCSTSVPFDLAVSDCWTSFVLFSDTCIHLAIETIKLLFTFPFFLPLPRSPCSSCSIALIASYQPKHRNDIMPSCTSSSLPWQHQIQNKRPSWHL